MPRFHQAQNTLCGMRTPAPPPTFHTYVMNLALIWSTLFFSLVFLLILFKYRILSLHCTAHITATHRYEQYMSGLGTQPRSKVYESRPKTSASESCPTYSLLWLPLTHPTASSLCLYFPCSGSSGGTSLCNVSPSSPSAPEWRNSQGNLGFVMQKATAEAEAASELCHSLGPGACETHTSSSHPHQKSP